MEFGKRHDTTDTTDFCTRQLVTDLLRAVFENTYFTLFSDFKKHDFLRIFEMTYQKVIKKVTKKVSSLLNVYRNFGLKTPGCYGYL